ncbi:DNA translocase FtsK [Planococcus sp. FY231025]|uniref:DNA translocase FtsK n=1 Tax=Planococcus sp. FY231025 TaxID=3455699 RepID=UPI003F8F385B
MSWVKKVWSRLFTEGTEEDAVEPVREPHPAELERPKKAPFRFPLISDNEKEKFVKSESAPVPPAPRRRPSSPVLNKARGYEPPKTNAFVPRDVPPVREPKPLEPRAPRTYNAPAPRKPQSTLAPRPYRPRISETPKLPKSRTAEPAMKKTRPFEPTRVPSPIHGYNETRPEPVMNLLEKKAYVNEQPYLSSRASAIEASLTNKKISSSLELEGALPKAAAPIQQTADPIQLSTEETVQTDQIEEAILPAQDQAPAEAEKPEKAIEQKQPVLQIETEQVPVVDADTEELPSAQPKTAEERTTELTETSIEPVSTLPGPDVAEETKRPETTAEAKPAEKKEKTVPFNVLMLKSDKQRLSKPAAAKPAQRTEAQPKKMEVQKQMMSDFDAPQQKEETEPEPIKIHEPARVTEAAIPAESGNSAAPAAIQEEATSEEPAAPAVYEQPKSSFLRAPENDLIDEVWMEEQGERLIEALSHFQIQASILGIVQGPAVTQFELTVAQGVKVSKIRNLADDLKLALAAKDIRIQAPIPGKSSIGIEIPNRKSRAVRISEVIESRVFQESDSPLEAALGLDLTGRPVTLDLRKMPHGLIAGATGSGKSVCINSLLVSLLYKSSPRDLKMLLIDPKMVELAPYNHIPHLISPVITDVKAATASLKWAVEEMERRYQLFAHTGVRDISRYNKMVKEKGDHAQHLPYILIVIDELADLMMMSPSDVEDAICRIAQKARACGIHLVIATQRPSVDVITGLIKSNIPTRIAFSVSSQVDSRTILDSQGAERLLGRGDMLYLGNGMSAPVRIQGTFVTDDEIEDVIEHVRAQGEPEYIFKEDELIRRSDASDIQDDLFEEACRFIMSQGSASTSLLQRKFHIGYNRAARLMDLLEQHGFISEQNGSKARTVLITEEDLETVFQ